MEKQQRLASLLVSISPLSPLDIHFQVQVHVHAAITYFMAKMALSVSGLFLRQTCRVFPNCILSEVHNVVR